MVSVHHACANWLLLSAWRRSENSFYWGVGWIMWIKQNKTCLVLYWRVGTTLTSYKTYISFFLVSRWIWVNWNTSVSGINIFFYSINMGCKTLTKLRRNVLLFNIYRGKLIVGAIQLYMIKDIFLETNDHSFISNLYVQFFSGYRNKDILNIMQNFYPEFNSGRSNHKG